MTLHRDQQVLFDPFDLSYQEDPYPVYERMRRTSPVHRNRRGQWVLTRYADVSFVLGSPHFARRDERSVDAAGLREFVDDNPALRIAADWFLFRDPPDHTRLRSLVNDVIGKRMQSLEGFVEDSARHLVDVMFRHRHPDVVRELAEPLPALVLARLLSVPALDEREFYSWVREMVGILSPAGSDDYARANGAALKLEAYFTQRLRTHDGADDFLGRLLDAEGRGILRDRAELVATAILLVVAGYETTANFIGNAVRALIRHPPELERLASDMRLIGSAVEELLRFDGPVLSTARIAQRDTEVEATVIRADDEVLLLLAAANHDAQRFPDPQRLDVGRPDNRHLAFAGGIHACLGARFARLEGAAALRYLVPLLIQHRHRELSAMRRASMTLRGFASLVLELDPAAA